MPIFDENDLMRNREDEKSVLSRSEIEHRRPYLATLAKYSASFGYHARELLHMFLLDGNLMPNVGNVEPGAERFLCEWQGRSVAIDDRGHIDVLFGVGVIPKPKDLWAGVLVIPPAFIDAACQGKAFRGSQEVESEKGQILEALEVVLVDCNIIYDCRESRLIEYEYPNPVFRNMYGTCYTGAEGSLPSPWSHGVASLMIKDVFRAIRLHPLIDWVEDEKDRALRIKRAHTEHLVDIWDIVFPGASEIYGYMNAPLVDADGNPANPWFISTDARCLQDEDRQMYSRAIRMIKEVALAFSCIYAERGKQAITIREDQKEEDVLSASEMIKEALDNGAAMEYLSAYRSKKIHFEDLMLPFFDDIPDICFPKDIDESR